MRASETVTMTTFILLLGWANALAQTPLTLAPPLEPLPLGLQRLHWGMPLQEAVKQLETLAPRIAKPKAAAITSQQERFFGPYAWNGCTFEIWTYFGDDKLDDIELESHEKSPECRKAVRDGLEVAFGSAYYDGDESKAVRTKDGLLAIAKYRRGNTRATLIDSGPFFLAVTLTQLGGAPMTIEN